MPQGTQLGPWLFLAMINDLTLPEISSKMWKFADDTTVSEVVEKSMQSSLQSDIDHISMWSTTNLFQLNPIKCKEMIISFTQPPSIYEPLCMGNQLPERVTSIKSLRVRFRNDLKWNDHVNIITSKSLYLLKQLKRADVVKVELVKFYCSCLRSVLEYVCQLVHSALPQYLVKDIEHIQKRALRI